MCNMFANACSVWAKSSAYCVPQPGASAKMSVESWQSGFTWAELWRGQVYATPNICHAQHIPHPHALFLLANTMCSVRGSRCVWLVPHTWGPQTSFPISASSRRVLLVGAVLERLALNVFFKIWVDGAYLAGNYLSRLGFFYPSPLYQQTKKPTNQKEIQCGTVWDIFLSPDRKRAPQPLKPHLNKLSYSPGLSISIKYFGTSFVAGCGEKIFENSDVQ